MPLSLKGANVLVTGASRGLGPRIALEFARRGARVALAARSREGLELARRQICAAGGTAVAIPADVTVREDRDRLLDAAETRLGPVHVLVNNAGITSSGAFAEVAQRHVEEVFEVNIVAPMLLTRLVLPGMITRGRGHVVNVSSLAGKTPAPWSSVYSGAKHALVGWTHSLRAELRGTGVGASVVCPGFVADQGMFADWATPGDVTTARRTGLLTTSRKVAHAVADAVERDAPELLAAGPLGRLANVIFAVSPRAAEAIARRSPATALLRREAEYPRAH